MNQKLLEEIGLTKGEITVYFTLLKLGETTTGKIIDEAEISSGKIYEILEKLTKKGLVSYILKEKTKHFSAANPHRILDFIHEKEKELKSKEEEISKEIPLLLKFQDSKKEKHETHLYKGYKGIQTAIFEALSHLKKDEEVLAMGIVSSKKELFNTLWQNWHMERLNKKIRCRAIFSDKGTGYYNSFKNLEYTQVKYLEGITPSAIDIMGNHVLIFTYEDEPSCLLINNPEISRSFKNFFDTLWKIAKK